MMWWIKTILTLGLLFLSILAIIYYMPDNYQFCPYNYGPQGISDLYSSFHNTTSSVTLLIIVGKNIENFSWILNYVSNGNTLIIAGNYTLVNSLLSSLGVKMILEADVITCYQYYINGEFTLINFSGITLVFPFPHAIVGGIPIVKTSKGQSLVSYLSIGKGRIILFSTPYIFINKYYKTFNNSEFIHELIGKQNLRLLLTQGFTSLGKSKEALSEFLNSLTSLRLDELFTCYMRCY
ncbi:hypothetical protein [Acidianus sp. RZ1]|uniref:hypothetical protein n=1 Tax=Acidianus sp. RZ1 TaxID=1540082 RepID=UPI001492EB77|nr:hypothetical protein [Acidianus sp. RZ1]NON61718.1 hypothetical protein [Acidianus sp. RZ1]